MTEADLETARLRLRIRALEEVLRAICTGLSGLPEIADEYRAQLALLRQEHAQVVLEDRNPAESDMLAGEYQEALDDVLRLVNSALTPP